VLNEKNWCLIGDSSKTIIEPTCVVDGSVHNHHEVLHLHPHNTTTVPTSLKHGDYETLTAVHCSNMWTSTHAVLSPVKQNCLKVTVY